jgi:hypothetical protein
LGIKAKLGVKATAIPEMVAIARLFASIQVPSQSHMLGHGSLNRELFALVIPLWSEHLCNRGFLEKSTSLEHPAVEISLHEVAQVGDAAYKATIGDLYAPLNRDVLAVRRQLRQLDL